MDQSLSAEDKLLFPDLMALIQLNYGSPASEQSAYHAANQSTWTATTAVVVSTTPAATTGRTVVVGFVAAADAGLRR
jgi:hypothetical protein